MTLKIGFIGAGKMAQALARGLINSGKYQTEKIIASSPKTDMQLLEECKELGINTTHDNAEVSHNSDVIFVAVKPQHVAKITSEIAPSFKREQILVSVAMGIPIRFIENLLPSKSRVIRVMPNTPAVVGAAATAYSVGSACLDGDSDLVQKMMSTVGYAVEVPEIHLDSITGLSGSGPSYIFSIIEGLSDGGVKMGLPRDLAIKLAANTVYGAAKLLIETGEHPSLLKEQVQSPGGTTIYGMHELEKGSMKGLLINAVEAASMRAKKMGEDLNPKNQMENEETTDDSESE